MGRHPKGSLSREQPALKLLWINRPASIQQQRYKRTQFSPRTALTLSTQAAHRTSQTTKIPDQLIAGI